MVYWENESGKGRKTIKADYLGQLQPNPFRELREIVQNVLQSYPIQGAGELGY